MSERQRLVAYWITTILGPASFVIGGVLFLTRGEQQVAQLAHLGYPPYLLSILGFWKLAGAVTVVLPGLPRLKEWAYAGFFFDLTGASASHAFAGDAVGEILAPLLADKGRFVAASRESALRRADAGENPRSSAAASRSTSESLNAMEVTMPALRLSLNRSSVGWASASTSRPRRASMVRPASACRTTQDARAAISRSRSARWFARKPSRSRRSSSSSSMTAFVWA